jgi:protein SCO1
MSRGFLVILAILALAFAVITGVAVNKGLLGQPQQTAAVGGPFHLVAQTGKPVDERVLKGRWSAVFFGYTNCPDACPTTLFALAGAEKRLGAKAADFQTVFISVDPARDDAKKLASYLSNPAFPRRALGLTGTPDQVAAAARAYKVFYQTAKDPNDPTGYSVNHSTFTYLMNPKGRFACVIPFNASPEEIAGHVQKAMAQGDDAESC